MTTFFQSLWCLLLSFSLSSIPLRATSHVYIVYLGHNHGYDHLLTSTFHAKLLSKVFSNEDVAKEALIYSYKHCFSGFAANINSTQATTLARMDDVISVFRSKILKLHTTRSWDFMGLTLGVEEALPMQLKYGDDVIVGILDTGIWPESSSFKETPNTRPIPTSWRGKCIKSYKFNPSTACNRKLIGARYYLAGLEQDYGPLNTTADAEYRSPRDRIGHGTHTASTAAGSIVPNASFLGLAAGIVRGGAPLARLAVYKVCWLMDMEARCSEADILAAFDDAIRDGVNVLSVSLGASPPLMPYFSSSTDIGSFHAMQVGVAVVYSAGNDGPESEMVQNVSPWGICVAASTIDRRFPTELQLGNNMTFMGESFVRDAMNVKLIDSGKLFDDGVCSSDSWNGRKLASRMVVLCFSSVGMVSSTDAAQAIIAIKGSGMIFVEPATEKIPQDDFLPTVHVDLYQGTQILYYILSSVEPTVRIFPSKTVISRSLAPSVAYFSSRGPNSVSPNILKPDITAPGVNILAAWSQKSSPTLLPVDKRTVSWNFDSGTSMSCPHVSGTVALIKAAHPDWSTAAIKSALMTTANIDDLSFDSILDGGSLKPANPFDIGSGHINPLKVIDPGLVYEMDIGDYIVFLCSIGYTKTQIRRILLPSLHIDINCFSHHSDMDLNYPAITVSDLRSTTTIKRTLRNVGQKSSVYFVSVVSPQGVHTMVWPRFLVFSCHKEKLSYYVTFTPIKRSEGRYDFGEIVWFDGRHRVRSPLIVRVNNLTGGGDDNGTCSSI